MPWTGNGFRVAKKDPAFGVHFLTGGLLIQEEAAMMAVAALDPQPGERILDLCAAPGNKSVQLAKAVGHHGWVVANDVSESRLNVLRGMADRFRLPNLSITVHDGASFPIRQSTETGSDITFDAVLADVPCSCEGTCRKHPRVFEQMNPARVGSLHGLQEALLRRAIRLTRPGGRVLYATCTFAPEENEMVVDRVLREPEPGHEVQVEQIKLPGVVLDEGITHWQGKSMSTELKDTVRIWPHRNDTGGFYLALLRKAERPDAPSLASDDPSSESAALPPEDLEMVLDGATLPFSAYGMPPSFLKAHSVQSAGRKHNRILTASRPELPYNEIAVGFSGVNLKSRTPRPSSALAAYLAMDATAGLAELPGEAILPFLRGETVQAASLTPPAARTRYVLVRSAELPLGLGHVEQDGRVASLFPRHVGGLPVAEWLDRLSDA